jgi:hypothetical protein
MTQSTSTRNSHSLALSALVAAAVVVAFAVKPMAAAHAEEGQQQTPAAVGVAPEKSGAVIRDGAWVVIDPETGEIVSRSLRTGKEFLSDQLATALSRSTEGLETFDLVNGGQGVHLGGRFQHVFMVRVRPDGSFETVCVNHEHQAEKVLQSNDRANPVERAVK